MRARTILLVLCLIAAPAVCVGQHTHQFEIGAYGSFTRYDRAFGLDNQIGGGGRLGYFFSRVLGAEFDLGYQQPTPTGGSTNATLALWSGSLTLNFGNEHNLFYILGGYTRVGFSANPAYDFTDNGFHGAIGDRMFLGERFAVRIEGRAIYSPSTGFPSGAWAGHVVGSAGLSIFTGPSAFRDADQDGVADRRDTCPGTPGGAVVDAQGCPSDSDRDKVYNGLDACPNTVEGAEVDARGCPKDADADGVYDGIDKCPATATGSRVDARGCPTDTDADGVPDGPDQCPNTPAGATVDANGCPVDSDRDGVPDGIDKCPSTPAGTEVDTAGCQRASDTDGDGVDDTKDKCPGTATGTRVDAAGCPILFTEARTPVVLRGVTFETGRSALKPDSYTILDIVAASLIANPDIKIEIAGHTDATGSAATNTRLSQARADAVRAYLASKGVAPERMVSKGYGPSQPVAPNSTPAGRAQNRRVELRQTN
ncbi:MAG TPA: OmpA family protein [Gemmatimonadales bacterium]|jgi:outer membrane protein OmpA-like peptidoglycan-associated protein|nr:OmpA family protein [Gemmatimonadales bacterium]